MKKRNILAGIGLVLSSMFSSGCNVDKFLERQQRLAATREVLDEYDSWGTSRLKRIYGRHNVNSALRKVEGIVDKDYRTAIKEISTPLEAAVYCINALGYSSDMSQYEMLDYWADFKEIHERKADDCDGGATAAAALLHDDGFAPKILEVYDKNLTIKHGMIESHVVFVYRTEEGYGSIGIGWKDVTHGKKNLKELIDELSSNHRKDFEMQTVYDIKKRCPDYNK